MSQVNRRNYVAIASMVLILDLYRKHEEASAAEVVWCDRIIEHLTGPAADAMSFSINPKDADKLQAKALAYSQSAAKERSPLQLVLMWMTWADDCAAAVNNPLKRHFFEELLSLLDGLYALLDPLYEKKADTAVAISAACSLSNYSC